LENKSGPVYFFNWETVLCRRWEGQHISRSSKNNFWGEAFHATTAEGNQIEAQTRQQHPGGRNSSTMELRNGKIAGRPVQNTRTNTTGGGGSKPPGARGGNERTQTWVNGKRHEMGKNPKKGGELKLGLLRKRPNPKSGEQPLKESRGRTSKRNAPVRH